MLDKDGLGMLFTGCSNGDKFCPRPTVRLSNLNLSKYLWYLAECD